MLMLITDIEEYSATAQLRAEELFGKNHDTQG